MLTWQLIVKNGIRRGIERAICYKVEANNKDLNDYDETEEGT